MHKDIIVRDDKKRIIMEMQNRQGETVASRFNRCSGESVEDLDISIFVDSDAIRLLSNNHIIHVS